MPHIPPPCLTNLRPKRSGVYLDISFDLLERKEPSLFTVDGAGHCQLRHTCQTARGRAPFRCFLNTHRLDFSMELLLVIESFSGVTSVGPRRAGRLPPFEMNLAFLQARDGCDCLGACLVRARDKREAGRNNEQNGNGQNIQWC